MSVGIGGGGQGPSYFEGCTHTDIMRVTVTTLAGDTIDVPLYDSVDFPEVRFAVLVVSYDLRLNCAIGYSGGDEELARIDFHPPLRQRQ